MTLTHLYLYPIKSCAGISVQEASLSDRGLTHDRRWMLVDPSGQFMTQRNSPEMALIRTKIDGDMLRIWHARKKIMPIEVPLAIPMGETKEATLWGDVFPVSLYKEEVDQWFSGVLGRECHLVYMHEESRRPADPKYVSGGEIVSMADGYPHLIIGQASLDQLNEKLEAKGEVALPMDRFRPNLVFTGGEAHEEDHWKELQIGEVDFLAVKPCARCNLTTINQETAEVGKEPLRTLATYRKEGAKILFGMNLIHKGSGTLRVGDEINPRGN